MRRVTLSAASALICLGCAASQPSAPPPAADEIAPLSQERLTPYPVSTAVEGRSETAHPRLVPEFKEPSLTPEEKRAMGEEDPFYPYSALYRPRPGVEDGVSTDRGGVSTGVAVSPPTRAQRGVARDPAQASDARAGASVSSGPAAQRAQTGAPRAGAQVGESGSVEVGAGPARRAADHRRDRDP